MIRGNLWRQHERICGFEFDGEDAEHVLDVLILRDLDRRRNVRKVGKPLGAILNQNLDLVIGQPLRAGDNDCGDKQSRCLRPRHAPQQERSD